MAVLASLGVRPTWDVEAKPLREVGAFFALSLDILVQLVRPPFAWREFIHQSWFVARVSMFPAVFLAIPLSTLPIFIINVLLVEIGAADASGTGAALASVVFIGPIATVLVIAGTGATAMCAELGARTIREEIDAMRVMGISPVQRLLVPRVLALGLNGLVLNSVVTIVSLVADYLFSVYFQHVNPGTFAASLTLLVGLTETITAYAKAALFGVVAGLIACYKGMTVGGGPQGVGNAVNETVVYTFLALFIINGILLAITTKATM
ncbi:MlaE family ABC transporter permease [Mycobacterium seoulense]|uniref:MlaE family ABC transporter permease n=1 Tax=Mycobacterium TaxID=1763 RepID=UPI0008023CAD|nr:MULTISPECIES: ABC transporter permease [Mycobacterium]MCV7437426.1 ABC transporter permease [Mycobacterium seoulense]OBH14988.1 ABC transporter permease [Mycobacterium sp. E3247]OBH32146.1 ABC transporter permease [Mycobacterium sp. E342]